MALAGRARNFLSIGGPVCAVVTLAAVFGLPQVAGTSAPSGGAHVIDTNRVIGTPFERATANSTRAGRGHASAPSITTQPTSETRAPGSLASFTASASGNPTPSVRWQESINSGGSWSTAPGASTSTTYSFTATTSENGYRFRAVFTNSAGSATTNAVTLTVTTSKVAPTITSANSTTFTVGTHGSFTVTASGSPAPTFSETGTLPSGVNLTTAGVLSGTPAAGTASTYPITVTASNGVSPNATQNFTLTVTAAAPPPPSQSTNWSGYADTGATFTSVSSSWTVPTVTCSGTASTYSAQWIGIDGYGSSTVEQDGTEADCLSGTPTYDAWYEMYGDNAVNNGFEVELAPSIYPVSPGDTMSATVSVSGTTWTLAISDSTKWSFSQNETFSAAQSSAEWVVERPEICYPCGLASLANFGSVTFSNASASTASSTNGSISSFSNTEIEMVSSKSSTVLALPTALTTDGKGFSDNWLASS